jgi:phenylpropionate dioxygenase-like ring-hydroxylating dioxygenase large terminal subunit
VYTDPAVLAREKTRVFGASWQLVGRAEQVASSGDFFTARVEDEEVLVVRGEDDTLRALSNVCRHRAGPVAAGTGSRRALRCGYHGWTYALQIAPIKREGGRLRADGPDDEAAYWWIWPNLMLNVYPDNFSTNLIVPLSPERTLTIFEWFFHERERPDVRAKVEETVAFSDEIQIEDIAICEAVQRGLRSKTYVRGRYSARRESGVHLFHRLWAAAMELPRPLEP